MSTFTPSKVYSLKKSWLISTEIKKNLLTFLSTKENDLFLFEQPGKFFYVRLLIRISVDDKLLRVLKTVYKIKKGYSMKEKKALKRSNT